MTQRPIKFRAWSDLDQKFVHTAPHIKPHIDQEFCTFEIDSRNDSQPLTLQQFTGLTDKNGKEIYEGDVLQTPLFPAPLSLRYSNEKQRKAVVFWHVEDAAFWWKDTEDGKPYDAGGLEDLANKCWVVGNIYENPEMVKVSQRA